MSDFNPELWGLRLRAMMGLPCPPPAGASLEMFRAYAESVLARHEPEERDGRVSDGGSVDLGNGVQVKVTSSSSFPGYVGPPR